MEALPPEGDDPSSSSYPEVGLMATALEEVKVYGATSHESAIRAAMTTPSDDSLLVAALDELGPSVRQIVGWHDLGEQLAITIPQLLEDFDEVALKHAPGDHLPAVRALALMLGFLLDFDLAKLSTPSIQNDFSFVKRAQRKHPTLDASKGGAVSMFIAQSSPMIARIAISIDAHRTKSLATVATLCCAALGDKRLPATKVSACLTIMTSAFVLYDRAAKAPGGAFGSSSLVSARKVAYAIKKHAASDPLRLSTLYSAYRYTTLNYNANASTTIRNVVER
ncbi:hypothetical protein CTAYLR_003241 [Chrysophaeum taylorii]|uniref:CYRIA/CYRIB Rac1 binding domain-containing protein n=1 Tax=Chrysophaeum taylorii TaxID=2483200 RepID=A0AAD7UC27_9STRA|nr:hypothetical protein CTAYLR_003241 [Chrysophaeum taylorii]